MKKMYWYILLGICITLGAYSVIAGNAVRGIGIYAMGNTVGWIFSVTRHYTGAAAVILFMVLVIKLLLELMKRKKKRDDAASETSVEDSNATPVVHKNGKIQPAAPQQEMTVEPVPDSEPKLEPETQLMSQSESEPESQPTPPKFCVNCGAELKADMKFCTKCGTPVSK